MQQQVVSRGKAAPESHREVRVAAAGLAAEEVDAVVPPCWQARTRGLHRCERRVARTPATPRRACVVATDSASRITFVPTDRASCCATACVGRHPGRMLGRSPVAVLSDLAGPSVRSSTPGTGFRSNRGTTASDAPPCSPLWLGVRAPSACCSCGRDAEALVKHR